MTQVYVLVEHVDFGESEAVGVYPSLEDAQGAVQGASWTTYNDGSWSCGLWSIAQVPFHSLRSRVSH